MIRFVVRLAVALVVDSCCRPPESPKRMRHKPTVYISPIHTTSTAVLVHTVTNSEFAGWRTICTGPATIRFIAREA